ncbi:hypothetical protein [Bacillus anthracis]|uniref:hypothetical protein n=1 Tax=Bacillus anthracis TaxID=1392 RepID=UPI003BA02969
MKRLKVFSALALSAALVSPSLNSVQAASHSQLTYTQTGANYMYSNTPETIAGSGSGYEHRFESGKYSYYTLQRYTEPNKEYVAEFYNHNNAGATTDLTFGYAVYNGSNTTKYVTVKNDAIKSGTQSRTNSMDIASQMEIAYMNDTQIERIAVPAWGSAIIKQQTIRGGNTITGKLKFTTDGNLTVRQFVSKKNGDKFPTATDIMDLNKTPQVKISTSEQTTANYRTDTRKATVDYNTTKSFYVGAMGPHPNPEVEKTFDLSRVGFNEYEMPIDKIGPQYTLHGNYGILYEFTIKNGAGKRIKIDPSFYAINGTTPSTFVYFDGTKWTQAPRIENGSHIVTIPSNGVFKYILPGGTNGVKLFNFID